MGHGVKGRDYYLRHIVYQRLSSFEMNIWQGIKQSLSSMPRRARWAISWYTPYFVTGYLLLDWMDKENWKSHRKVAADFENDE